MYFVYIIQSELDQSFYIGYTQNLEKRIHQHNHSNKGYTSKKKPWIIRYHESFETKSDAIKREKFLKNQKNTQFYESLIHST